ncbi:hypothetical protein PSTG_16284 [Puccinia striiformis f. sp. tritici PST-78]|uniref:OTU domain-containing protein n=1 Tax=Puccinia striiformis f. sp. tritici PST-78 TaxID=1165861 RepID=A0A0L0UTA2_9BASI|nr:hypothetical protein PSTG_16284 [Puccinia striiformis f. sp. tritici PST-78]
MANIQHKVDKNLLNEKDEYKPTAQDEDRVETNQIDYRKEDLTDYSEDNDTERCNEWTIVNQRIRHLISHLHEVDGDGHCGFRAASVSMAEAEDGWLDVRKAMVDEMDTHEVYKNERYISYVADSIPFTRLRSNLNYFRSPARIYHWINFPCHGDLLADAYQRPVIHLSHPITNTYLPLSHGPNTNPPICLVYLEGKNHYNVFQFEGSIYPAPIISPGWFKWRSEAARGWEEIIQIIRDGWDRRFPHEAPGSPQILDITDTQ